MNAMERAVHGPDGRYGSVDMTRWPNLDEGPEPRIDLKLDDGRVITVPADVLIEQHEGSYYVPMGRAALGALSEEVDEDGEDGEAGSASRRSISSRRSER